MMPKILLVEDERSIAEGLKVSLESEGFQVGWAKDGNEALAAWDRTRPDLIVLDLMLPGDVWDRGLPHDTRPIGRPHHHADRP
jgi:Response regulators consisting of a CheY-like receiver domain and a winged-helix DNA-binding domain